MKILAMARKQNKSLKVNKKDSSISVNNKKIGKVQKKISEWKAKKAVESKIKQVAKPRNNTSQVKQDSSSKIGRKSGRINPEVTKKSSPNVSSRAAVAKVSTSTRASVSSRITGKVQSTTNKKTSPVIEPRNKKVTSATKAQKVKKDETAALKRGETKMNLRGKKRSYAQMASGNESVEESISKKKKTAEPKNTTSRRSRSIKPTAKVAEWRSVVLQKKSNTNEDKSNKKSEKSSSVKRLSRTANKSPKSKTPKTQVSPAKKSSPRKSVGRKSTVKIQNPPSSKSKVKNVKNISSSLEETPNARRSRSRNTTSTPQKSKNNSSKPNTLAASIKNKFNSCITSKRKSKDTELQENVVVAQGILHDILFSVGNNDISISNEELDKENETKKTVNVSDSQVSQLVIDHDVLCDNKQENLPSKTESDSDLKNELIEKNNELIVNIDLECNSKFSDNGGKILINQCNNEEDENAENVSMEDMELHLSDTSSTHSNNDMVSIEVSKSKSSFDPEQSSEISNVIDSSLTSESKLNDTKEAEVKLHNQTPLTNHESSASTAFGGKTKESSLLVTENLQKNILDKDLSSNKNESLSQTEVPSNILEVTENSNSTSTLTCTKLNGSDTSVKGLSEFSNNRLNNESDSNDLKISINTLGDGKKEKMATGILNAENNSCKNEMKTDSDTHLDEGKICFANGKSTVSNLSEVNGSSKKDDTITKSVDQSQNGQIFHSEIEINELMNGKGHSNGVIHRDEEIKSKINLGLEDIQDNNIVIGDAILENNVCLKSNIVQTKKDSEEPTSKCLSNDKESSVPASKCQTEINLEKSQDDELNSCKISDKPRISENLPPASSSLSSTVEEENIDIPKVSSDCKTVSEGRLPLIADTEISAQNVMQDPSSDAEITHCNLDSSDSSKLVYKETIAKEVGKEISNVGEIVVKDEPKSGDSDGKRFMIESSTAKLTQEILDNSCSSKIENLMDNAKTDLKDEKICSDDASSSRNEHDRIDENCSPKDSHLNSQLSSENTEILNQTNESICSSSEVSAVTNKDKEPIEEVLKMEEENLEITQDPIIVDETDGESMQCSSGTLSNRMSVDEENAGMEVDSEGSGTVGNASSTTEINMEVS